MELMERYIYAVTKYLPVEQRNEVAMELRGNILDMLPEEPTEADLEKVLRSLGSPRKLSEEYHMKKRYLIGPSYYDKYFEVLKLVVSIVMVVLLVVNVISFVFGTATDSFGAGEVTRFIIDTIASSFSGGLQAAFWVTVSFVIMERTAAEEGYHELFNKEWSPRDLKPVPTSTSHKISKFEASFSFVMTVIFMVFLYTGTDKLGIFWMKEGNVMENIPIFNMDRLHDYLVFFWIFAIGQAILFVWQMVKEYWDMPLAIFNFIFEVAFCVFAVIVLLDRDLLNPALYLEISKSMGMAPDVVREWLVRGKMITAALIVVLSLMDSIGVFFKVRKGLGTKET